MEEQMVPSAGFSPQSDSHGTEYTLKFPHYGFNGMTEEPATNYCNLADAFDLSLLGDGYDDQDMATVPSPSWSPTHGMNESTGWQQSFYASSPSSGDYNAYSPDCKPVILSNGNSPIHSSFENFEQQKGLINATGNRNLLLRQCLEDTSFQQKVNFKPMDFTISLLGANEQMNAGSLNGIGVIRVS